VWRLAAESVTNPVHDECHLFLVSEYWPRCTSAENDKIATKERVKNKVVLRSAKADDLPNLFIPSS